MAGVAESLMDVPVYSQRDVDRIVAEAVRLDRDKRNEISVEMLDSWNFRDKEILINYLGNQVYIRLESSQIWDMQQVNGFMEYLIDDWVSRVQRLIVDREKLEKALKELLENSNIGI